MIVRHAALGSVKLPNGCELVRAHASGGDVRLMVILSPHRHACQPAQHCYLAHMRERIGDGALKELLRRFVQKIVGSEVSIECFKSSEATLHFRIPCKSSGTMPTLLPLGYRQRPVHQVADMRENIDWRPRVLRRSKLSECVRCSTDRFPAAISESGQSVAK